MKKKSSARKKKGELTQKIPRAEPKLPSSRALYPGQRHWGKGVARRRQPTRGKNAKTKKDILATAKQIRVELNGEGEKGVTGRGKREKKEVAVAKPLRDSIWRNLWLKELVKRRRSKVTYQTHSR